MLLFLISILCLSRNLFGSAEKCTSHYGKEFYLGFIHNFDGIYVYSLTLDIASTLPGTMYIHVPFLGINRNMTIHKGSTVFPLDETLQRLGTFVENRGIYLKSNVDVSVYATNYKVTHGGATDTYLAFPAECLGNTYVATGDTPYSGEYSEIMVIGVHDSTVINMTRSNDTSIVKTINRLDTFQYSSQTDLTNVFITSNKPISVISGVTLTRNTDMIMSQMQPTESLGKVYIVPPIYSRASSRLVIINTAKHSNNVCSYDNYNATCNMTVSGDYLQKFDWKSPVVVVANSPVSVTEYTRRDAFMSSVASVDHYLSNYSFVIPGVYSKYNDTFAAVVIPTNNISGLRIDGKPPTGLVRTYTVPQPLSNYTVQVYRISIGYHYMSHVGGVEFGLFCYGNYPSEAFGYLAGIGFATDIDDCASNPCHNGTCKDAIDSYTCACYPGYTGQTCQINIDDCAADPCHNGTCIDVINGFNCSCYAGYTGKTCDINIDECASSPCHNGICIDKINGYSCRCHAGYTGQTCHINIDDCATDPCHKGTCIDGSNGFNCSCFAGYAGYTCNLNIDECATKPCHNGSCIDGINGFNCSCYAGYTGYICETDIDECSSNPCHTGVCIDRINGYTCSCYAGYSGQTCDINIDECATEPCHNGSCIDGINGFNCSCYAGYTGYICETDIDECSSNPCHTGVCIDRINGYTCSCYAGYSGQTCDINIDDCATKPCHNGTCIDGINGFNCSCYAGYTGYICETDIDECSSNPCHTGVCIDRINGYTCSCHAGYSGQTCDINIDECMSSPCQYGGSCTDWTNSYTCHCAPGYTGLNCQTEPQSGPVCFNCADLSHAGLCDTVHQCHNDEICYLERYHQNGQIVSYKSGCIQTSTCYERGNMTINMVDECVECCTDNYCNNKGCTDSGLPPRDKRGPVCFDCQHVAKPDECHMVQPCQTHEVCAIEEKRWGDDTHYKMGCSSLILCDSGRSDDEHLAARATPICKSCCTDDFCNRNCTVVRNTGSFIIG